MKGTLSITVGLLCAVIPGAEAAAGEEANKETVRQYVNELWNQGNFGVADTLLAKDFVRIGPTAGTTTHNRSAFKTYFTETRASYKNFKVAIDKLTAKGDTVMLSWTVTGAFTGTPDLPVTSGKAVDISGTSFFHLKAGKLTHERVSWDVVDWFRQVGVEPLSDETQQNMAIIRKSITEMYNKGNISAIDQFLTSDYVGHALGSGMTISGVPAVKETVAKSRAAFPDLYLTVENMVAEGDRVVVQWMARGTHKGEYLGIAPSGKSINIGGLTMYRLAGGKIAEAWSGWDQGSLFRQIGVEMPGKMTDE